MCIRDSAYTDVTDATVWILHSELFSSGRNDSDINGLKPCEEIKYLKIYTNSKKVKPT